MAALNLFTFQQASTVVALGIPNAFSLPTGSTPTTLIVTNQGPETAQISLAVAAATTTATQAVVGSTVIVVASNSGIAVGQIVLAAGIPSGSSIPAGYLRYPNDVTTTTVLAINSTSIIISNPTTAVLSSTAINFVTAMTPGTGMAISPNLASQPLAIGSNTYLLAYCPNGESKSVLNLAVGV